MNQFCIICYFLLTINCYAQDIFKDEVVHEIRLEFSQSDWKEQLKYSFDNNIDIPATLYIEGIKFDSAGVKYKGHSSYLATQDKKPFNITLDAFIGGQSINGYNTLNLNNGFKDPSFIREIISYQLVSNFLPAVKSSFVKLYINNEYWGLYLMVQQPNRKFLRDNFGSDDGNYYKADPIGDLVWVGNNPNEYKKFFEKKTNENEDNWNDIINLINILNNSAPEYFKDEIEKILNIDRALWYLAFCNVFCNLDSYTGSGHNYYLYVNPTDDRFNLIPWDLNENLGVFQMGMTIPQLENLNWDYNIQNNRRPLIQKLLSIEEYKERYIAHQVAIIKNYLNKLYWKPLVDKYQELIKVDLTNDTKKLYPMNWFYKNVNEDTPLSQGPTPFIVPGVLSFIEHRKNYFDSNPLFQRLEPTIISVTHSPDNPESDDEVKIVARIMIAKSAILWYSINNSPFIQSEMILTQPSDVTETWEGIIPTQKSGSTIRYYVESVSYENAHHFYPEFAEYQTLSYIIKSLNIKSEVVINEIQAGNQNTIQDPQGSYADWIELFNTSSNEVDLSSKYLSDNPNNPLKWKFPDGITIPGNGYLIIWADGDTLDSPGIHTNFKLSKSGESAIFSDTDINGNVIIDSTTFGEIADDYTWGRIPNGFGNFKTLIKPTPGKENVDNTSETDNSKSNNVELYLFQDDDINKLYISISEKNEIKIYVTDILGTIVTTKKELINHITTIINLDMANLPSGVYFVNVISDKFSKTLLLPIVK